MTPVREVPLRAVVSGDWFWDDEAEAYTHEYEVEVTAYWNGWAEFRARGDVLARIFADQPAGEDFDSLRWDGDALVHTSPDDPSFSERYHPPNAEGWYEGLGFGWTWTVVRELDEGPPPATAAQKEAYGRLKAELPEGQHLAHDVIHGNGDDTFRVIPFGDHDPPYETVRIQPGGGWVKAGAGAPA